MRWSAKLCRSIDEIDPDEWNRLSSGYPVLRHEFLRVLETSGVIGAGRGVWPAYLTVRDEAGTLRAAAPAMAKANTIGEAGPEVLWLREGARRGLFAMPKWQVDVAFMPIMTPKLLTDRSPESDELRMVLLSVMHQEAVRRPFTGGFSLLRITPEEAVMLHDRGFLISHEVHSRWHNPGYSSHEAYLQSLPERKRYQVRKERRAAAQTGLALRVLTGSEVSAVVWDDFFRGHLQVCRRHRSRPWMSVQFYHQVATVMPEAVLLLAAFDGPQFVAGLFCLRGADTLCLRNWSELGDASRVSFEIICHLPIEWAIAKKIRTLESGLPAAHKTLRGFGMEMVPNAHWIPDEDLRKLASAINQQELRACSRDGAIPLWRSQTQESVEGGL